MDFFVSALGCELMPVLVIDDASRAARVIDAIARGGITCAEITLRTPDALSALASAAGRNDPDFVLGAGTVKTADQFRRSVDLGAQFVVSPGLDAEILELSADFKVPMLPGIATATEVMAAERAGVSTVKFFPADVLGGPAGIQALTGPFAGMRFIPSGGVSMENASEYLSMSAVACVSGSWIAPRDLIATEDYDEIERRSRAFVALRERFGND